MRSKTKSRTMKSLLLMKDNSLMMYIFIHYIKLAEFCEDLANEGKIVLVAALDGTFDRKVYLNDSLNILAFQKDTRAHSTV